MKASALRASSRMLHSISGGASDTDANELMVMPSRLPSADTVVTRHTPVGNAARDCRKDRASEVCGMSPVISVQEYIHLPAYGQYWPFGVRPSICCPTIADTASQFK